MNRYLQWAGGGYFRFIPYCFFKQGIDKIINECGLFTFYIHSWEIDWKQPKVKDLKFLYRLRHYANLKNTYKKLGKLANEYRFIAIRDFINT